MAQPRAVLLDLDRTLVDLQSFTDYASALADLTRFVGSPTGADVPAADWDVPTLSTMAILVGLAGDDRWADASAAVAVHERAAIDQSRAMPGLADAMDALRGVPCAVVTLLPVDVAADVLAHHGVRIDVIVGRDPRIPAKPSGAGLVVAAERLGVPIVDCVMIGDSSWDYAAAVDASAAFIGVPAMPGALPTDAAVAGGLLEAVRRAVSP